ncbi:hypothetical protein ACEQ8H_002433 [Pleosporales sp. CAS-2024a]
MPPYLSPLRIAEPSLPPHCEPANPFLYHLSATLHSCVPTNLALVSTLLGTCSIVSWLFAQLPQIYKIHQLKSTSGLSAFFLGEWLLGDVTNLLGCLFAGQASWQIIIASYYVFVDCCLCTQWLWYELLHHGRPLRPIWDRWSYDQPRSSPQIRRVAASTSPMASPRTVLYISLILAVLSHTTLANPISPFAPAPLAHRTISTPVHITTTASATETAGKVLSWMSTFLYLGSRLPQLYKNQVRKSTAGLSPILFAAAFFGNLFYSSSLLANPCAWFDFAPGQGAGWVDPTGSDRTAWLLRATPFFLGAAGVLIMDAAVGLQFVYFGDNEPRGRPRDGNDHVVITIDDHGMLKRKRLHWRRVSGWMRGWAPAVSVAGTPSASRATTPAEGERSPESSASGRGSTTKSTSIPIRGNRGALDEARALLGTSRHASPRSYGAFGASPR